MALSMGELWSRTLTRHPSKLGSRALLVGLLLAADGAQWPTGRVRLSPQRIARFADCTADDVEAIVGAIAALGFLRECPPDPADRLRRRCFVLTLPPRNERSRNDSHGDTT